MVIEILLCRHCPSQNVIKHGRDRRGVQRFRCRDCGRTFQKPEADRRYTDAFRAQVLAAYTDAFRAQVLAAYTDAFRAQVLAAYQERASMRGVSRVFGLSRLTLADWLKKSQVSAAAGPDVAARPPR